MNPTVREADRPLERCIPSRTMWSKMVPALTAGEMALACKLDDELPNGWSIAVQRKVNNAVPDVLCFHPEHGILVFEVKDWDPNARVFRIEGSNVWTKNHETGVEYVTDDPVGQVMHYKDMIAEMFPSFTDAEIMIATVVVLTKFSDTQARELLEKLRPTIYRSRSHQPYFLIVGSDSMAQPCTDWLISVSRTENRHLEEYRRGKVLSPLVAERMMWLLRVPELEIERYIPLQLDSQKQDFLRNPNRASRRKVRGAVGSGKSTLLAARTAQAVTRGESVLVITFTITLRHWLHRLIVRGGLANGQLSQAEFSQRTKELVWRWYIHEFARAIANTAGRGTEFRRMIGSSKEYPEAKIREFIRPLMTDRRVQERHKYDLVVIDEMQNVEREWLEILEMCVAEGGEMVIFGDPAQNVYGRDLAWTTSTIPGFPGRWNDLKGSYRFPPALYPVLKDFYDTFELKAYESEGPTVAEMGLFDQVDLVWYPTTNENMHALAAKQLALSDELGAASMDAALLALRHADGLGVLREISGRQRPPQEIPGYAHVFSHDPENAAHLKKAFWPMRGDKKMCTVHSFQGWEARYVVFLISERLSTNGKGETFDFMRSVYVGLSRIVRSDQTSRLVVVNAERSLDDFFTRHFRRGD